MLPPTNTTQSNVKVISPINTTEPLLQNPTKILILLVPTPSILPPKRPASTSSLPTNRISGTNVQVRHLSNSPRYYANGPFCDRAGFWGGVSTHLDAVEHGVMIRAAPGRTRRDTAIFPDRVGREGRGADAWGICWNSKDSRQWTWFSLLRGIMVWGRNRDMRTGLMQAVGDVSSIWWSRRSTLLYLESFFTNAALPPTHSHRIERAPFAVALSDMEYGDHRPPISVAESYTKSHRMAGARAAPGFRAAPSLGQSVMPPIFDF